jgi:hypothetical protein
MFVFPLLGIVLLVSTAAADQDPLADRGNWALGLALPSSSGLDLSLWKVRSPVTAFGLEIDFSSYYSDHTSADLENFDRNDSRSQYRSLRLQLRPTIKHYRPMQDRVAPFVFYQAHADFSAFSAFWSRLLDITERQRTGTKHDLGIALGLGADWFPFQRISLSGQTGLALSYFYDKRSADRRKWEWSLKTFQTEVAALVYF